MLVFAVLMAPVIISSQHAVRPISQSFQSTAVCGQSVQVALRFSNDWEAGRRGVVSSVSVAGKEVAGLAKKLSAIAGNRAIHSLVIRECGPSIEKLRLKGEMYLSEVESVRDKKESVHVFRFDQNGIVELSDMRK